MREKIGGVGKKRVEGEPAPGGRCDMSSKKECGKEPELVKRFTCSA
jgi:hypothetical protein